MPPSTPMRPTTAVPGTPSSTDGRTLRGERTRGAIVEALRELLQEGEARPTSRQIASRAGVSVRSIFQHFEDIEGLYADLVRLQARTVQPLVDELDSSGTLEERIEALATQRARLFEAIAPLRHAVGTRAASSPTIARRIRELSDALHAQVLEHFTPELGEQAHDPIVLAVDALCSFEVWDQLRTHHALGTEAARQVLVDGLTRLLAPR